MDNDSHGKQPTGPMTLGNISPRPDDPLAIRGGGEYQYVVRVEHAVSAPVRLSAPVTYRVPLAWTKTIGSKKTSLCIKNLPIKSICSDAT
jgi:hypothetical protein